LQEEASGGGNGLAKRNKGKLTLFLIKIKRGYGMASKRVFIIRCRSQNAIKEDATSRKREGNKISGSTEGVKLGVSGIMEAVRLDTKTRGTKSAKKDAGLKQWGHTIMRRWYRIGIAAKMTLCRKGETLGR